MNINKPIRFAESDDPTSAYMYGIEQRGMTGVYSMFRFGLNLDDVVTEVILPRQGGSESSVAYLSRTNELFYSIVANQVVRVKVTDVFDTPVVQPGITIELGNFNSVVALVSYNGTVYALVQLLNDPDIAYEIRDMIANKRVYAAKMNNSPYDLAVDQITGRMYVATSWGIVCTWINSSTEADYTINTNPPSSDQDPYAIPADRSTDGEKSREKPFRLAAHNNIVYYTTNYKNLKRVSVTGRIQDLRIEDNGVYGKAAGTDVPHLGYSDIAWVSYPQLRQAYPPSSARTPSQLWISKTRGVNKSTGKTDQTWMLNTLYPLLTCPSDCSGFGTCDVFRGSCTCFKGHYGADCSGCQRPPAGGCFAKLAWPSCIPDEGNGISECSDAVTADISKSCCLSPPVLATQKYSCPAGWHVDTQSNYCTSSYKLTGPNELRYKCSRDCPK